MEDIRINGFTGMNNLIPAFWGGEGVVSPRVLLNADVDESGQLTKRDGYTAYISLSGSHSLWASENVMLCAAGGKLYRIISGAATEICDITGPTNEPLSYVEAEDNIYISNVYWRGVFDPSTNTVSDWGIDLPSGPMCLTSVGNLPAGTYHITFTNVSGDNISGNGPITAHELSDTSGIQVLNRPDDALVWATDQNGYVFSLVGAVDTIVDIPTVEPLPCFMCSPPPNMGVLMYAFGRIWGADGDTLYYSEPYQFGWFKLNSNFFRFESDITLLAAVSTGVFVGMADKTVFLRGTDPGQMEQIGAGAGSVKGTLAYCNNLPELGDVLGTPEKGHVNVPVWRTYEGIVAGNISGRLFNLTKHKLRMSDSSEGAALFRMRNGVFQYLTSAVKGSGSVDSATIIALQNGQLTTSNFINQIPNSVAQASDEVSIEVRRGGVLIEP